MLTDFITMKLNLFYSIQFTYYLYPYIHLIFYISSYVWFIADDNVNFIINDNKEELKKSLKPLVQEVISKLILDLVNSIFNNFSLEDVLS